MTDMILRAPVPADLPRLNDLNLRSKAVWGYDAAFMEACREELALTEDELATTRLAVIERGGTPLALVQTEVDGDVADLLKLFVDPSAMGLGLGARLFAWAVEDVRGAGASRMTIEADPDAAPFYEHMGAKVVGSAPSGSVPGRVLPLLELNLHASAVPDRKAV